jgi:hypothetical protein
MPHPGRKKRGGKIMTSATAVAKRKQGGNKGRRTTKAEEQRRLVDSIMGKYAWIPYSSEDFNRDKRREIALENRA